MAIPGAITLSRRSFHSSGVKFDLPVMRVVPRFEVLSSTDT
jgi:hypothetical protein